MGTQPPPPLARWGLRDALALGELQGPFRSAPRWTVRRGGATCFAPGVFHARGGEGRGPGPPPGRGRKWNLGAPPRRLPEALWCWAGHSVAAPGGTWRRRPTALRALGAPRAGMARSLRSWLGVCLLASALGMVPPPENVRMNSVNFKNILEWESPAFPEGNLTFTAQYLSYRKFQDVCANTTQTRCDFSGLSKYGNHTLRVRAEGADEHSQWVTLIFCPVDDTDIGPPGIHVEAVADSFHIRFSAPGIEKEHETWTMRNFYDSWVYNVQYWKNGSDDKHTVACPRDFEVVGNLEPWTTYCVRVQGFLLDQNKAGAWSQPVCEQTSSAEAAPSWVVVAAVLGAAVCGTCLLLLGCSALLWCVYKRTEHTFSRGNALPQHLKEFLNQPHRYRLLFAAFPPPEDSEVFDKLSVVAELPKGNRQDAGDACGLGPLSGWDLPAT